MEAIKHTKICTKCKLEKDLSMFSKKSFAKDNLQPKCKICEKQYREENKEKIALLRKENLEKNIAYKKEYRKNNKYKISIGKKEYYAQNKEKLARKTKEYREDNKEKVAKMHNKYYMDNKEKHGEQGKKYREENKEKIAKYQKEYYFKNKVLLNEKNRKYKVTEKGRLSTINYSNRRRMLKINKSNGTIPMLVSFPLTSSLQYMLISQNYSCNYCGSIIMQGSMHLDHIKPLAKGGTHSIDNVQWLCPTCNLQKGSKLEEEFLSLH